MELIDRVKAPTPKWWRKVQIIAGGAAGVAVVLLTGGIALPAVLATGLTWVSIVGGTVAATAQFTKDDKIKLPLTPEQFLKILTLVSEGTTTKKKVKEDFILTESQMYQLEVQ